MKQFCLLLFFSFALLFSQAQSKNKKIYVSKGSDNGAWVNGSALSAGDTVALRASDSPFSYVYMPGLVGTLAHPIIVINEGGPVHMTAGFSLENCQYVHITGTGSRDQYGFQIKGAGETSAGSSINIAKKSKNVEVNNVSITNAGYGFWIKNEADCDNTVNNWVLDSISVHDCYFRNMNSQAFYAGTTAPNGDRPISCNGKETHPRPSRLGHIRIYNNYIDSTGRSGIQLSNASVGLSEIFNNHVNHCGRQFNDWQGNGIGIGSYSRVYIHHNKIRNTYTDGIMSFGSFTRIENNNIDSSGYLEGKSLAWPWNILVDTRETIPVDSTSVIIRNNVMGKAANKENIYLGKQVNSWAAGNEICNNTSGGKPAKVFVTGGIRWTSCGVVMKSSSSNSNLLFIALGVAGLIAIFFFTRMRMNYYRKDLSTPAHS
ncbi:MAG: right-handed parallel beta-helix repeat-containing protein [Flavisolibacter sp.]